MNTYILKVKVGSTWHDIDFGNDMPAISFQANNLAELQNRQGTYSQSLKLPKTANNKNILGISSETTIPYTKLECRLWVDSYLLLGAGGVLIIDKVTETIEVQLLDASVDFIKELQGKKMSAVDIGYYTHGSKVASDDFQNTEYCIPVATFQGTPFTYDIDRNCYPFVFAKNIFDIIAGDYTTDLLEADWETNAINVCDKIPYVDTLVPFSSVGGTLIQLNTINDPNWLSPTSISIAGNEAGNITNQTTYVKYISPDTGGDLNIRFKIPQNPYPIGQGIVRLRVYNFADDPDIFFENQSLLSNANTGEYTITVPTIEMSNLLDIRVYIAYQNFPFAKSSNYLYFDHVVTDKTTIPLKARWSLSRNLGFDTQADFVKSIMQLYGLTFYQDKTGAKFFYTMQKVIDNKVNAPDWSDKMDMSNPELAYTFGSYAQKNYINFEKNVEYTKQYEVDIADTTLEPEKTLFTLKYESGLDQNIAIGSATKVVAQIPLEEVDDEGVVTWKGGKPHYCEIVDETTYLRAVHKYTDEYYDPIRALLNNIKVIECYFNLTAQDVYNYSPMTPIYLKQYGRYFYINKISNFIAGKKTKVELIKLPL